MSAFSPYLRFFRTMILLQDVKVNLKGLFLNTTWGSFFRGCIVVNISRTLKKSTFLVRQSIFRPVHKALGGPIFVFCSKDLCIMAQKISKNGGNMKIFLESCKETSKLSRNIFWGRWDHIVAQKSIFKFFFFEKPINSC